MKLKQFFTDDDAVSPVIGVILMVAITVILAAVIASFVLGLGQDTGDSTPAITFSADYDQGSDELEITVSSASDNVDASEVKLKGEWGSGPTTIDQSLDENSGSLTTSLDGDSTLTAGTSVTVTGVASDYDIDIIWTGGSQDSSVLRTITGPDA